MMPRRVGLALLSLTMLGAGAASAAPEPLV